MTFSDAGLLGALRVKDLVNRTLVRILECLYMNTIRLSNDFNQLIHPFCLVTLTFIKIYKNDT